MKSLKNLVSSSVLALSMLFAASSANALIIKHDIIDVAFDSVIGSVEVEIKQSALNTGIIDTAFDGPVIKLVDINLFGFELDLFFFGAVIDTDNIFAGIEFLELDGDDVGFSPAFTWSYQIFFDGFAGFGFLDVFDASGGFVSNFSGEIALGAAQVSAPASLALLTLAMGLVFARRNGML